MEVLCVPARDLERRQMVADTLNYHYWALVLAACWPCSCVLPGGHPPQLVLSKKTWCWGLGCKKKLATLTRYSAWANLVHLLRACRHQCSICKWMMIATTHLPSPFSFWSLGEPWRNRGNGMLNRTRDAEILYPISDSDHH